MLSLVQPGGPTRAVDVTFTGLSQAQAYGSELVAKRAPAVGHESTDVAVELLSVLPKRTSGEFTQSVFAAEAGAGRFSLLQRARMGRSLNPEAGTIGGGGFTGSTTAHGAERIAEAGFDDIDAALVRAGSKPSAFRT